MTPLLTFGDMKQKVTAADWQKKKIGKYFFLQPGIVGIKDIVAAVPEKGKEVEGVVPPSMIGMKNGQLCIILQTSGKATYKNCAWAMDRTQEVRTKSPVGPSYIPPTLDVAGILSTPLGAGYKDFGDKRPDYIGLALFYKDVSTLECAGHPETFIMETGVGISGGWASHSAVVGPHRR